MDWLLMGMRGLKDTAQVTDGVADLWLEETLSMFQYKTGLNMPEAAF